MTLALSAGFSAALVPPAAAAGAPTIVDYSSGLPSHTYLQGIVPAADGNVWFLVGGSAMGEINPHTGAIQTFPSSISGADMPTDLVAGPDGNLWFTDDVMSAVGTFGLSSHQGTEFTAGLQPGGESTPTAIAAGPDGNLWFTDPAFGSKGTPGKPAIGMINPSTRPRTRRPCRWARTS